MNGRVVVITGANSGIGLETAVGLAAMGATTILACRNPERAARAAAEVAERAASDLVHAVPLDLADLASVAECAAQITASFDRVDILINNAGGMWTKRQTTAQGLEQTFGVNHLGHFYFTNLLLERLMSSAPARIINISSAAYRLARHGMRWDDLQQQRRYSPLAVYAGSKLANVLFTKELARRFDPAQITANAVHPGPVRSGFGMDGDTRGLWGLLNRLVRPFEISPLAGADTPIFLAVDPSVATESGGYWVQRRPVRLSPVAGDDAAAERLWSVSEALLSSVGFALAARN